MQLPRLMFVVAAAVAVAALPSQNPLAYPQDSTQTGSGNLVPMGYGTSGNFVEGRYQVLIPANHLPPPGTVITGAEFFSIPGTGSVTYPSLDITLSHSTSSTLSTTFASNLPAPTLCYTLRRGAIQWSQRNWVPLPFSTPFIYDGVSNLVVDIQKVVTPAPGVTILSHGTESRTDLPRVAYAFGVTGSGANNATMARTSSASVLKFRLSVGAPTVTVRSDPGTGGLDPFAITNSFDATVRAIPNTLAVLLASEGYAPPGTTFPPITGFQHVSLAQSLTLSIGAVPMGGATPVTVGLPNDPNLVGLTFVLQAATLGSTFGGPTWSAATDFVVP